MTFPEEDSISIASASDLKTVKLVKGPNDTGSVIYLGETLKAEVDRVKVCKEKIEQSARLSASLRRDIETTALRKSEVKQDGSGPRKTSSIKAPR